MAPHRPSYTDELLHLYDNPCRSKSKHGSSALGEKKMDHNDYRDRRVRNNVAVRKSRQLSRQKAKQMEEKVSLLHDENRKLEQRVKLITKELTLLKDLFLSSAVSSSASASPEEEEMLNQLEAVTATSEGN